MHTVQEFLKLVLCGFILMTVILTVALVEAEEEEVTIYNKDWKVQERIQGGTIYDRDWRVKGHIEDGRAYDRNWNTKGYIKKGE